MHYKKILIIALILLLLSFIAMYWYIFPAMKPFPEPTGHFGIGTTTRELVDDSRDEMYSPDKATKRKLVIRIWYPTVKVYMKSVTAFNNNKSSTRPYVYQEEELPHYAHQIAAYLSIPYSIAKKLLSDIQTHTFIDAPFSTAKKSFPVVIISHGLIGNMRDDYTALIEELVSHGYIVIAIDHAYLSPVTVYTDGTVVSSEPLNEKFLKMTAQEQYAFQTEAMKVYVEDTRFVLNELEKLNNKHGNAFYHRLDLDHNGIIGHSGGGTAAIEAARIDKRIKAVINMDGWFDHVIGWEPLQVPLLLLFAGAYTTEISEPTVQYLKRKQLTRNQYFERERRIQKHKEALCAKDYFCKTVYLPGVSHGDFNDTVLYKWPFRAWNAPDSYKTLKLINSHVLEFLSSHLKDH